MSVLAFQNSCSDLQIIWGHEGWSRLITVLTTDVDGKTL